MKTYKLDDFTKGWFVGNFSPTIIDTKECEVAVKTYKKGDKEEAHYHKVSDEITVVTRGKCRINEKVLSVGDMLWIKPGEVAEFEALEDTTNTVVKIPSIKGDKYIV